MNRAVLVGIETYNAGDVPSLSGCINDISGIQQFLTSAAGFDSTECTVLTNQSATRGTIVAALQQMVNGLNSGDRLVFHYAGHGAGLPNNGAVEDAMIPVDFSFPTNNAIFGSELAAIFGNIPAGVAFSWIADCCNSGGQTRSLTRSVRGLTLPAALAAEVLNLGNDGKTRSVRGLTLPAALAAEVLNLGNAGKTRSVRDLVAALNLTMYAACQATEDANGAPINGVWHGVLSYYLTSLLMDPTTVDDSANALMQSASVSITPNFPQQHPGLRGDPALWDQPFLPGLAGSVPRALNPHFTAAAFVSAERQERT